MSNKPEALRLADMIERYNAGVGSQKICEDYIEAAAELRRLHAINGELVEALKNLAEEFVKTYPIYYYAEPWAHDKNESLRAAHAALSRAQGETK